MKAQALRFRPRVLQAQLPHRLAVVDAPRRPHTPRAPTRRGSGRRSRSASDWSVSSFKNPLEPGLNDLNDYYK